MQITKRLLLVENDTSEAPRAKQAFESLGAVETLVHAPTLAKAIECLRGDPQDRPSLIVLNLDTTCTDGLDFLRSLKEDHTLCSIPVVVLASSYEGTSMHDSFTSGAAGYMVKPDNDDRLLDIVETIDRYWSLSRVPRTSW